MGGAKERLKALARRVGGPEGWEAATHLASATGQGLHVVTARTRAALSSLTGPRRSVGETVRAGVRYRVVPALMERQVFDRNAELVIEAFEAAGVTWWWVDGVRHPARRVLAVPSALRTEALRAVRALARDHDEGKLFRVAPGRGIDDGVMVGGSAAQRLFASERIVRLAAPVAFDGTDRFLGNYYGCDVEFWDAPDQGGLFAPRPNRAAAALEGAWAELVEARRMGRMVPIPAAFTERMLEDVDFPIDVVYTWVDGDDPAWLERKAAASGAGGSGDPAEAVYHAEANHEARFRSRDELRFSLRSIDDFAPWVNHIYIVTDRQVPRWLDVENPKVTVVDHREIFPENANLPVFNSNAIISRLHHIPGLSEHFIYMNDDVFLGRAVGPDSFFTAAGIALVSPSNLRRPFAEPDPSVAPHFNLTSNMRALLQRETGRTVSRAIKHTPHPMLKSVLFELEARFAEEFANTISHPFRHHTDIVADQLHHYYAQILGKAVPGHLEYSYINVRDVANEPALIDLLHRRHRDALCLNDAPVATGKPIPVDCVRYFLAEYFPAKSSLEFDWSSI